MRHLILILSLLAACNDGNVETRDISDDCVTCPSIRVPVTSTEADDVVEPVEVETAIECPSAALNADLVQRTMQAMADPANRGKFIIWEDDYGNPWNNPDNVRVVFDHGQTRYTVWNNPTETIDGITHGGWISVWERPIGTYDQRFIETYTADYSTPGCVNFGINGKLGDNAERRYLRWSDAAGEDMGLEYHGEWQSRYDSAITVLADALRVR